VESFAEIDSLSVFSADKMKKNNIFATKRFFCDVYCFEPGQAQKPHAHVGSDKLYLVVDGLARIRIGDEERDSGPGAAVLAPAGVEHGVVNPGPGRLRLLVVMAPPPAT
jgi:mannose-6-phosphate isomerase-like protein (cupin superfamily)